MSNPSMGNGNAGVGNYPGYAAGHSSNAGQGLANQSLYQQQQAMSGLLSQHAAAYTQQLMSIHARQAEPPPKWMVDGKTMTFQEFVDAVFPDDSPERTFFLLKYKK